MKPSIYTRLNNVEKKLPYDSIEEECRRFFSKEEGLAIAKSWKKVYQEQFDYYFSRLNSLTVREKTEIEIDFKLVQSRYKLINQLIEAGEKYSAGGGRKDSPIYQLAERFGDDFEEFKQVNKEVYDLACNFLSRSGVKELSSDEMQRLLNAAFQGS